MKLRMFERSLLLGGVGIRIVAANNYPMHHACTVVRRTTQVTDDSEDLEWDCELDPQDTDGLLSGIRVKIVDSNGSAYGRSFDCGGGGCLSGSTKLYLDETNIVGDTNNENNWVMIEVDDNSNIPIHARIPNDQSPGFENTPVRKKHRNLNIITPGPRDILVVRVSAPDSTPSLSSAEMSDEVFGTNGDPVNLKSQMDGCSYGTTTITPAAGSSIITDGVVDVNLDMNVAGEPASTIMNAVTYELNSVLNSAGLDTIMYDHVMYCLPPKTKGSWIAFAFLNDNLSVYNDFWCGYVSVQMHEIGHNLGLDHSGNSVSEYEDRIGYMGLSYSYDDLPEMCFNAPKSWQLGWYSGSKTREINDITTTGSWAGTLVGISDFDNTSAGQYVLLKITKSSSTESLYLNFNRVSGINKHTQGYQDRVIVTSQEEEGRSTFLSGLTVGQSYVESDFDGNTGRNFAITVTGIDFTTTPWTADISIEYGPDVIGIEDVKASTNITIQEMWNIGEPNFMYNDLDFQLEFNVSDYLNENQVDFELYEEVDCSTPINYGNHMEAPNTALFTRLPTGAKSPSDAKSGAFFVKGVVQDEYYTFGAGTKTFSLGLSLNPNVVESDPQVYTYTDSGPQRTAQAKFCVRFKLLTPDQSMEVNFFETLVYLNLDLTNGFSIGDIILNPKDALANTANQVYEVIGFRCNYVSGEGTIENPTVNVPLSITEEEEAKNQGSIIRICVKPDTEAEADGIKMRSIDQFTFNRDGINQIAISDGKAAKNLLTSYYPDECKGNDECWFESVLFASFYSSSGVVLGSGFASMQFGSRRNLLRGESDRTLQFSEGNDAAAVSEFELDFDVSFSENVDSQDGKGNNVTPWFIGALCSMVLLTYSFIRYEEKPLSGKHEQSVPTVDEAGIANSDDTEMSSNANGPIFDISTKPSTSSSSPVTRNVAFSPTLPTVPHSPVGEQSARSCDSSYGLLLNSADLQSSIPPEANEECVCVL